MLPKDYPFFIHLRSTKTLLHEPKDYPFPQLVTDCDSTSAKEKNNIIPRLKTGNIVITVSKR